MACIIRSVDEIRLMKQQPGKAFTLSAAPPRLQPHDQRPGRLIRLVVQPVVLGGGKALFKDVNRRHELALTDVGPIASDGYRLIYRRRRAAA